MLERARVLFRTWLSEPTARELLAFADELVARHAQALTDIPLGPLELCHFETMHHFEPVRRPVRAGRRAPTRR